MTCYALVPAAGSGSRFAAAQPKQYLALAGKPMLWHAVAALARPPVETVFVVLAPGDNAFASYDWSAFAGRIETLYCGGATRRDSVYNGLVAAMADVQADDWMLVHDAARPCLPARGPGAAVGGVQERRDRRHPRAAGRGHGEARRQGRGGRAAHRRHRGPQPAVAGADAADVPRRAARAGAAPARRARSPTRRAPWSRWGSSRAWCQAAART